MRNMGFVLLYGKSQVNILFYGERTMKKLALLLAMTSVASVNAYMDAQTKEKLKKAIRATDLNKVTELLSQASFNKDEKEAFVEVAKDRKLDLKGSLDDITGSVTSYSDRNPHRVYGLRTDIGYEPHWTWGHFFGDITIGAIAGGVISQEPAGVGVGAAAGCVVGAITGMVMSYLNKKNYIKVLRQAYDNAVSVEFEIRQKEISA